MIIYRGVFDRQDSLRSDYLSDRETRYGIVQQASIDSTDSRLCYLTSSEVSENFFYSEHFHTHRKKRERQTQFCSLENYIFAIRDIELKIVYRLTFVPFRF
jgi:hypothetical protein